MQNEVLNSNYVAKKLLGYHGECVITQITELPQGLKKVQPKNGYVVVAESEVTGNDHRVCVKDKQVEFYEKDGVLYMKNLQPVEVGCVIEERHDTCELPEGTWEFKKALEYDPLEEVIREARD